jgi:RND family efflux transporter MFP subunit
MTSMILMNIFISPTVKLIILKPLKNLINLNKKMINKDFHTYHNIKIPRPIKIMQKIMVIFFVLTILILIFTPWQQTSRGSGYVIALDPNNRAQNINATVDGRIKQWFVSDGTKVKAGDKLVEIIDNDPQIIERLQAERNAKQRKYEVAKIASETSKLNFDRQSELFAKGLSSKKNVEDAKIEYKKLLSQAESASAEIAESSIKLARQESQLILAPRDGIILKVLASDSSTIVSAGDKIASFAPILQDPAIELYVNGNDIPLIYKGRKVRVQFEGWPAIQFSGWPEIAIGTFGAIVSSVDSAVSENGKFRVIAIKDPTEDWPDARFLNHGAKVYGWVLLNRVSLGYEIWRQLNGFPPDFDKNLKNSSLYIHHQENAK